MKDGEARRGAMRSKRLKAGDTFAVMGRRFECLRVGPGGAVVRRTDRERVQFTPKHSTKTVEFLVRSGRKIVMASEVWVDA